MAKTRTDFGGLDALQSRSKSNQHGIEPINAEEGRGAEAGAFQHHAQLQSLHCSEAGLGGEREKGSRTGDATSPF
ncbi:unnamed protein product [Lota lota]